jgi:hypothetical protein
MKILALEVEVVGVKAEDFGDELKKAEARQVWNLYQEGVLREVYFRADRSDAVLMLECDDLVSAYKVIDSLPMVAAKLIDFDLIPLRAYPGLARLFA